MRVVIAGGHGQIARRLEKILADRGDQVVGLVRNPDQIPEVEQTGARGAVVDLEHTTAGDLARTLDGADAVVFAAGAGPGSGTARKETVDKGAAILLADAAQRSGVRRYVMVSAMSADNADPDSDDVFQVYLRAKAAADAEVRSRDLDWTIVRPGSLTDDPGTDRVSVAATLPSGSIPRDDVAAVLAAVLESDDAVRAQFDVVGGRTSIADAIASL